jgi:hypothetical protein
MFYPYLGMCWLERGVALQGDYQTILSRLWVWSHIRSVHGESGPLGWKCLALAVMLTPTGYAHHHLRASDC